MTAHSKSFGRVDAMTPRADYVPYSSEQIAAIKAGGKITNAAEWDSANVEKREQILTREGKTDLTRANKRWFETSTPPY
jgi:hypothetical protein